MDLDFDPAKNVQNLSKHNLLFEEIVHFEWNESITKPDDRFEYGEHRSITYGIMRGRLHILVWTMRGEKIRPISFRKANKREMDFYEKKKKST